MPRNGSGQYNPLTNTWNPPVTGVLATGSDFQAQLNDISAAISQSISKDGQTPMTASFPLGNNSIVGIASGTAASPSISPINDTNTGLYFPAADTVAIATGGVKRVEVDGATIVHTGAQLNVYPGASTQYELVNRNGAGFDFYVNNAATLAARITSGGDLLVGAASGFGARIHAATASSAGCITTSATASSGIRYHVVFYENTTERGSVTSNGGGVVYNSVSDYRLKENVAPMTGALAKVAQLNPVTYTWKDSESAGEGFIAHELQAVCPAAVTGDKDAVDEKGNPKYQGIDTSVLVATLTAAIQELKAINDAQAQTIESLTARITALEAK